MADSKPNPIPAVRTYADDVRRARGETPTGSTFVPGKTVAPNTIDSSQFRTLDNGQLDIRENADQEATIVTEHKVNKWSFSDALTASISRWWNETLEEIRAEQKLSTKVPPPHTRSDIIKAAASNAALAPHDDHASFLQKLRGNKQTPVPVAASTIAPDAVQSRQRWASEEHTPAPAIPVPPSPTPAPSAPVPVPVPEPIPAPIPAPEPVVIPKPVVAPEPTPVPVPQVVEVPSVPPPPIPEPVVAAPEIPVALDTIIPTKEDLAPVITSEFRSFSSAPARVPREDLQARYARPEPEEESEPVQAPPVRGGSSTFVERLREVAQKRKEAERENGPSRIPVVLGSGVVMSFIAALVIALGYTIISRDESRAPVGAVTTTIEQPMVVPEDKIPVVLTSDRNTLLADLASRVRDMGGAPGSVVNFFFVYATDAEKTALPAHAFIDTLQLEAPGSFLRTIDNNMMLGVFLGAKNAPFLILNVRDREAGQGGMWAWESAMNRDLAPLFGEDIGALGYTPQFTDRALGGYDVRILKNGEDETILIYGFARSNTIIITTDESAFSELAGRLK